MNIKVANTINMKIDNKKDNNNFINNLIQKIYKNNIKLI